MDHHQSRFMFKLRSHKQGESIPPEAKTEAAGMETVDSEAGPADERVLSGEPPESSVEAGAASEQEPAPEEAAAGQGEGEGR